MSNVQDKDTRYFVDIDLNNLKVIHCGFNQKETLDKGRQINSSVHRLFVTKGQYAKFVVRCADDLRTVMDE
jgi:hypothetical protein